MLSNMLRILLLSFLFFIVSYLYNEISGKLDLKKVMMYNG